MILNGEELSVTWSPLSFWVGFITGIIFFMALCILIYIWTRNPPQ